MDGTEEELYQRMKLAYERDDKFLINNWRILPSTLRLEIMLRAFRDGKKEYISMEHFDIYSDDLKIIKDAKAEYIQELGLSEDTVRELFWWYKPKGSINMQSENVNRNLAITAKLREYIELAQKYPALTPEMIQNNPNLLKCDSRRTESRICFLTDLTQGNLPTEDSLAIPLSYNSVVFCLRYQKELVKSLSSLDKDSDMYKTVMMLDEVVPDESNEKFWEKYLRLIYGDRSVEREIAKASRKNILQSSENITTSSVENVFSTEGTNDERSEQVIGEIVDDAFPIDEGYRWRGDGTSSGSSGKPNKIEELDEDKIASVLNELKKFGINCEGFASARSGTHAAGEDRVRFYVLRKENLPGYAVLEPFGQVGNCLVILDNIDSIERLKKEVVDNSISGLVEKRAGINLNHKRSEDQGYEYDGIVQRIRNTFVLIEEFSKERYAGKSFAAIRKEITTLIPKEETSQATNYLVDLLSKLFPAIGKKFKPKSAEISEKTSEGESVGTPPGSKNNLNAYGAEKIINFVTRKNEAEEVDF